MLLLPILFLNDANTQVTNIYEIPEGWMGSDVGPKHSNNLLPSLKAQTIRLMPPVGVFEMPVPLFKNHYGL
ncbi:MAG: hypothetical protein R2776_08885 [Flavobacteriaceae bacterium]